MTLPPITYKEFYNKDKGLPEPVWGGECSIDVMVQCPWCGSTDMYYSGSSDDPEEILRDTVRCKNCGHISDWYEANKQRENHPTDTPRKIIGKPAY